MPSSSSHQKAASPKGSEARPPPHASAQEGSTSSARGEKPEDRSNTEASPSPRSGNKAPTDPGLDALLDGFSKGNYAWVRQEGIRLLERTPEGPAVDATRALLGRLRPDPLGSLLLVGAWLLLAFLALYWKTRHGHPLPRP